VVLYDLEGRDAHLNYRVGVTEGVVHGSDNVVMLKVQILQRNLLTYREESECVTVKPTNLMRITLHEGFQMRGVPHRVCRPVTDEGVGPTSHYGGGELKPDLHLGFLPRSMGKLPTILRKATLLTQEETEALRKICEGRFVFGWFINQLSETEENVRIVVGLEDNVNDLSLAIPNGLLYIDSTRTAVPMSDGSGTGHQFHHSTESPDGHLDNLTLDERNAFK
jgi:hypothetical protein